MANAQQWLDNNYPKNERKEITNLYISDKNLTGSLDLSDFVNLQSLSCSENQLTNLVVKKCSELKRIDATNCKLTSLDLSSCNDLTVLSLGSNEFTNVNFLNTISHPEKLIALTISNNNVQPTTLGIFSRFTNLKSLAVGNDKEEDYKELSEQEKSDYKYLNLEIPSCYNTKFNRFFGSLEPLKNLTSLESLCIEATDVESGLEYLPSSLDKAKYDSDTEISGAKGRVYCSPKRRSECKVGKIKEQLKPFNYDLSKWKEAYRMRNQQQKTTYSTPTNSTKNPIVPIVFVVTFFLLSFWLVIKYLHKRKIFVRKRL